MPFTNLSMGVELDDYTTYYSRNIKIDYHFFRLSQLKLIVITNLDSLKNIWQDMKEIRNKVEYVRINPGGGRTENIPLLFPNLKHLAIFGTTDGSEWNGYRFPKLERFELNFVTNVAIGAFLKINPNIRRLAIDSENLWNNRESIKAAKLEVLAVDVYSNVAENFESFRQLFNELYNVGAYQRLELYTDVIKCKGKFMKLASLPAIIKLRSLIFLDRIRLSPFRSLEEIYLTKSYAIKDIEAAAENLENLQRIAFRYADLNDIIPFIRRARKLNKIKVSKFLLTASRIRKDAKLIHYKCINDFEFELEDEFEEQKVIDLSSLNAERAKLANAEMVALYVNEATYLATKQAMEETNFEFIQIKRIESYVWDSRVARGLDY